MKKILFIFTSIALLSAGCISGQQSLTQTGIQKTIIESPAASTTPASTQKITPTITITKQRAIDIVVKQEKIDLNTTNIDAAFKNNNWYVNTWPKPPTDCPNCLVSGGNAEFIVDSASGVIISRHLGM